MGRSQNGGQLCQHGALATEMQGYCARSGLSTGWDGGEYRGGGGASGGRVAEGLLLR